MIESSESEPTGLNERDRMDAAPYETGGFRDVTDGPHDNDGRPREAGQELLDEAWSLFTECLVIREGLWEACKEIERAMGAIELRLGTLAPNRHPQRDQHDLRPGGAQETGAIGGAQHQEPGLRAP